MSSNSSEAVSGNEKGDDVRFVDLGDGIHVCVFPAFGRSRVLHVLDRRQNIGSIIVDMEGRRPWFSARPGPTDEDRGRTMGASAVGPFSGSGGHAGGT